MTDIVRPDTPDGVREAVAAAVAEAAPLAVRGQGSREGFGRPTQAARTLDLSALSGITIYEPDELVLSARAGTPLAAIEAALAENRQYLPFEPIAHGRLYGRLADAGTIGGVVATNASGPRRIRAGAARDHVLGVSAVSGRGEAFKAGGRVVKNVTGYDLARGLAGSFGTLAVLTEVTLKVLPRPETAETLLLRGLSDRDGVAAMSAALASPAEVSGAAHLPADVADALGLGRRSATAIRLEGFAGSVAYRLRALRDAFAPVPAIDPLEEGASAAFWASLRDCAPFAGPEDVAAERPLWRVSVRPTAGPAVTAALAPLAARWFYDWGGGLVWIAVEGSADDAGAGLIRTAVEAAGGGHATLVRGSPALRAAVPIFQPQPTALAALSARLKAQFDPLGILGGTLAA